MSDEPLTESRCPACGDPLDRWQHFDGTWLGICEHCGISIKEPTDDT